MQVNFFQCCKIVSLVIVHCDFEPLRGDLVVADVVVLDIQKHGQPVRLPGLAARPHAVVAILQSGQLSSGIQYDLRYDLATVAEVSADWLDPKQAV